MDNFCKGAVKFFDGEFNRQDLWLKEQGLTVNDLDKMTAEQYKEINTKWREYDKQFKTLEQ